MSITITPFYIQIVIRKHAKYLQLSYIPRKTFKIRSKYGKYELYTRSSINSSTFNTVSEVSVNCTLQKFDFSPVLSQNPNQFSSLLPVPTL